MLRCCIVLTKHADELLLFLDRQLFKELLKFTLTVLKRFLVLIKLVILGSALLMTSVTARIV